MIRVYTTPLAQMNLRALLKGAVTASDVFEYGGSFCVSNASIDAVRRDLPDMEDHMQVFRVSANCLCLPMARHVSSEASKDGRESGLGDSPSCRLGICR